MFDRQFDYEYIAFLKKLGLSLSEISRVVGCHVLTAGRASKGVGVDLEFQRRVLRLSYEGYKL